MTESSTDKRALPPYLPHKTFNTFIDSLKTTGIPSRIDRSVLGSMSGTIQSALLGALRYFALVDSEDAPTDALTRLADSTESERKQLLNEMVKNSYGFVFKDGFDLSRATAHQLNQLFVNAGAAGETARKGMSFFLSIAKDAGIDVSPHIHVTTLRPKPRRERKKAAKEARHDSQSEDVDMVEVVTPSRNMELFDKLIDKFPEFNPEWSEEVQQKWFDSFEYLMKQTR